MTETITPSVPSRRAVPEPATPPHTFESLDAAIASVLDELRETTAQRERDRVLLHRPVAELVAAGFTAIRVPRSHGGLGGSLVDLFERLIRIASVDSNLAHVFRGHIGFVEKLQVDDSVASADSWLERAAGVLVGNAQSERAERADVGTSITRDAEGLTLTGVKYYTTGSIYSDWIYLSAQLDGERVGAIVDAAQPGVTSVDDWDGFGQPLTGSGTTNFDRASVDPANVFAREVDGHGSGEYVAAVFQLTLLAVIAGIGQAALDDTVAFVQPRRRIFGFAGEALPRRDELVQLTVGRVSSAADAARRLVLSVAAELDSARENATPETRKQLFEHAALDVFRAQQVVPRLILDATTELFEVGGASAVGRSAALDRHWRNARTLFSHNPAQQRERAIGEWELNGTFTRRGREQADPAASDGSEHTEGLPA